MLTTEQIKEKIAPLIERFQLETVAIFGSYANGNATEKSDVDFLVKFKKDVPSIIKVLYLEAELSRVLKMPVDLVTIPLNAKTKLKIVSTVQLYG